MLVLTGRGAVPVQVDCDDTQFFADFAEIYPDSHRIVATGNVKVGTPPSFITAERVEFDTKARTGTFYKAHGMASLGDRVDTQHVRHAGADAMFRGNEIHKLGPKKYKIVDGAFTHLRAADTALGGRVGLGDASTSTTTRCSRTRSSG